MKITENDLFQIDQNNMKARCILQTLLDAHQHDGSEDYNLVVEVVVDYLTRNHNILNEVQ